MVVLRDVGPHEGIRVYSAKASRVHVGRCFTVAVFKGPTRTDLLLGTFESARSNEPGGGGCQQTELVTESSKSDRNRDH